MVEIKNPVHAKFCNDIEFAAEAFLDEKETMFNRKFQNYSTKEKQLNFIQSQIKEIAEEINKGIELRLPPKNGVINSLEKNLIIAFKGNFLTVSRAKKLEFNPKLDNDAIVLDVNGTLSISPNFHFYNLSQFDKLINHVANIWFLQELEDLENEMSDDKDYPTGFTCNLHPDTLKEAYHRLVNNNYLEAEQSNFEAVFYPKTLPNNFKPVVWKKLSTRNKELNKKSLIDLLKIAGVKNIDIAKINMLFAHPNGGTINVKSSNIFNNKGNEHSEFYTELKSFFSRS